MSYEPDWDSLRTHPLPTWYDDAKLGVFLHWGLYSVPAWAPPVADIQTLLREHDPAYVLRHSPYAEWYLNTMQLDGSPTQRHHREVYGADFPYDGFRSAFDEASARADLEALADLCRRAGARYVVLTTKHHDGFCLWPSGQPHPAKGAYHAERDLVGDLTEAIRGQGLRMGLYYSGGYDWPFNEAVIAGIADLLLAVPQSPDYVEYADRHLRELIDRYRPSVLWNDIGFPADADLAALLAHYYNTVDDGVVNDRWTQGRLPGGSAAAVLVRAVGATMQRLWRLVPESRKQLVFSTRGHADFTTAEYAQHDDMVEKKWESTRGVGHSFGANRHEAPEDVLTTSDLVRSFVDVVAKNGNLLIGVGPMPDGTIPEWQAAPLLGLGAWLEVNGEAIFGSRPWTIPATRTSQGSEMRFTRRDGSVYAALLETPPTRSFELRGVDATGVDEVGLLGLGVTPEWQVTDGVLSVTLPDRLPVSPATVLRLGPGRGLRPSAD